MRFNVEGIIVATVTPFTKGGEFVDFDKIAPLVDRMIKKGAAGIFPCGTTGEGPLCSPDERKTILEETLAGAGKKAYVVAHTGGSDTATTIELTRHAQESGAKAAGIVTPSFYGYDDSALELYYKTIAKAVPGFPILLYNIPSCAKNALSAELIKKLSDAHENIVGIKDSSGSMPLLTRLFGQASKDFNVINGADEQGFQALVAGGKAVVSGSSNAYIDIYSEVFKNVQKGNLKKAWAAQLRLEQATRLFTYGGGLGGLKEIMRLRGFDPGFVRPPQREITAGERKKLAKGLEEQGLI